jgi:hypothetical protein
MRLKSIQLLAAFTLLTLAAPVWAHTRTASALISETTTIGSTQLKPGEYQLKVEDNANQLQIMQHGKVVAVVPVQWVQLQQKPSNTEILLDGNKITEVEFGGNTQAVQIVSSQ